MSVFASKAVTGGTGFIVSEYARHGTTETIAGMSPATAIRPPLPLRRAEADLLVELLDRSIRAV